MRYAKKIVSFVLSAVLALTASPMTSFAKPDWPSDAGVESEAGIVMDVDSGAVLYAQNIHMQKAPASITKILTALVVLEHVDESRLGEMVTFSHDAVYNVESGSGNKKNIDEGDQLSVEDCLYLLLLESSNQAANALAEHVAGSRDAFVDLMNAKLAEIGCNESHFANPSGLNDETQRVTAYDMALIARAAYSNAKLLEIGSTISHKLTPTKNNPNGATVKMEHKMLLENDENYYPRAAAGKTGYTSIAGQTLVTYAKDEERKLVAVTLKSTAFSHYKDTKTLLDFGFGRFKNWNIAENENWQSMEEEIAIGGDTYLPEELTIDGGAVLTLPKDAGFADADRKLTDELPEDHPEGAVAVLEYEYNERKIGSAYVYSDRLPYTDEPASEDETMEVDSSGEFETKAVPEADGERISVSGFGKIVGTFLFVIAIVGALVGGLFFYHKKKEEERRRRERRRARRKRVLEETGCSEEEFERLMSERMGKSISLSDDEDGISETDEE